MILSHNLACVYYDFGRLDVLEPTGCWDTIQSIAAVRYLEATRCGDKHTLFVISYKKINVMHSGIINKPSIPCAKDNRRFQAGPLFANV